MLRPLGWMWLPVALVLVAFVVYRLLPPGGKAVAGRLSMFDVWDIVQGLVSMALIGFLLYAVALDAVEDPATRLVLAATVAAMAVIALAGHARRRRRQRR